MQLLMRLYPNHPNGDMLKSENTDHVLHVFRVSGSLPLRCINEAWDSHAIDMAYILRGSKRPFSKKKDKLLSIGGN